jgi:hypothetical protein
LSFLEIAERINYTLYGGRQDSKCTGEGDPMPFTKQQYFYADEARRRYEGISIQRTGEKRPTTKNGR